MRRNGTALIAAALTAGCGELGVMAMGAESSVAKYVRAEAITGVVIDAGTGKALADAIVAMRFERNNTGHSGPHCFRSMAVKTDAAGRFRFAPWRQENTRANWAIGYVKVYKAGYSIPWQSVQVLPDRETAYRETLEISKVQMRLELTAFSGTDDDRSDQLRRMASQFSCRWQAEFDDSILLYAIRDEITSSSFANQKLPSGYYTNTTWIEDVIRQRDVKRDDSAGGKR